MAVPSNIFTQPQWKMVPTTSSVTWSWSEPDPVTPPVGFDYKIAAAAPGRPYIDRGSHHNQLVQNGLRVGCTMELVSALADENWTDHPRTAHPALAQMMITINDHSYDMQRQEMLTLVPRLLGTNIAMDREIKARFDRLYDMIFNGAAPQGYYAPSLNGMLPTEYLVRATHQLLDEFDKRIGRAPQKLDDQVLTQLMLALAA